MTPLPVEDVHEQAGQLSVPGQANPEEPGTNDGDQGALSGPKLHLLDLPAEILKEIAVEVNYANGLPSLARTCSFLHAVATPVIYSRFRIIWPEVSASSSNPRVDPLSYGLATLAMREDILTTVPSSKQSTESCPCPNCGCSGRQLSALPPSTAAKTRRGNTYAQHIRKLSLGPAPPGWVEGYYMIKEAGKILGTLVALAVARMINLETFFWDMHSEVPREVWIALSSLADQPGHECRLVCIWVRWHDNSAETTAPWLGDVAVIPSGQSLSQRYGHVEYPTLSILPPLRSITVLDVDQPSYLEELAVLIERSRDRLKTLRIGISSKVEQASPFIPSGEESQDERVTWPRAGGVLDVLTGSFGGSSPESKRGEAMQPLQKITASTSETDSVPLQSSEAPTNVQGGEAAQDSDQSLKTRPSASGSSANSGAPFLKLEVLELEKIQMSATPLSRAIDWTTLTTLTILKCSGHEKLWRVLRRKYAPCCSKVNDQEINGTHNNAAQSPLRLQHLRTDVVSPYLIFFIRDALAPNSLESVYFQEVSYQSIVGLDAIYRHTLRPHRLSLKRLMISVSIIDKGRATITDAWRKWRFNRKLLALITSVMPQLRELSMGIDRRDWHFLMQHLPCIPHLRALHITNINEPTYHDFTERMQHLLDLIAIKPEIQLTYIGIRDKCYKIVEIPYGECEGDSDIATANEDISVSEPPANINNNNDNGNWGLGVPVLSDNEGDHDDEGDGHEEEVDNGVDDGVDREYGEENDDDRDDLDIEWNMEAELNELLQYEEDEMSNRKRGFRLREVPFDDKKIGVFKARHKAL